MTITGGEDTVEIDDKTGQTVGLKAWFIRWRFERPIGCLGQDERNSSGPAARRPPQQAPDIGQPPFPCHERKVSCKTGWGHIRINALSIESVPFA
jgi:hypothetical protein